MVKSLYFNAQRGSNQKSLSTDSLVLVNYLAHVFCGDVPPIMGEVVNRAGENKATSSGTPSINKEAAASLKVVITRGGKFPSGIISLADEIGIYKNALAEQYKELMEKGVLIKIQSQTQSNGPQEKLLVLDTEGLGRIALNTDEYGNDRECNHSVIIGRFIAGIYTNTRRNSKDKNKSKKNQHLNRRNTLFIILLLSHSNTKGEIDNLSQAEMRHQLGYSSDQLNSQLKKLISMGLLHRVVPGGVFNSKRVKSKLLLDMVKIEKISCGHLDPGTDLSTRSDIGLHWLSVVLDRLWMPRLAQFSETKFLEVISVLGIEPMVTYQSVFAKVIPLENVAFMRYREYLTRLCLKYAADALMNSQVQSKLEELRLNPKLILFAEEDWSAFADENWNAFDQQVVNGLIEDLKVGGVEYGDVFTYKPVGEDVDARNHTQTTSEETQEVKKTQDLKLQKLSFLRTLRSLTWVLAFEVYKELVTLELLSHETYLVKLNLNRQRLLDGQWRYSLNVLVNQNRLSSHDHA